MPCFNEANRFSISNWQLLVDSFPDCPWVFVNDGSGDTTVQTLQLLIGKNVKVLNLPKNLGKGEAIRAGMISALDSNQAGQPEQIGYLDADGAFNISAISKMLDLANNYLGPMTSYCALISSRVKLSGRSISRSSLRHYLGRIIATSSVLDGITPLMTHNLDSNYFVLIHSFATLLPRNSELAGSLT